TNALPSVEDKHATAVAGLIVAESNNGRGVSGVAPNSRLASWKIFTGENLSASDEQMMDMFQYSSNRVSVQNHSWAYGGTQQLGPSSLEEIGISNAINFGRGTLGVVMVRA